MLILRMVLQMMQPESLRILITDEQVLLDRALYGFSLMIHKLELREGYSIRNHTMNPLMKTGLQCLM